MTDDAFHFARLELCKRLDDIRAADATIGSSLDRTLVTLSGGALIFSMTFITNLAPGKHWLVGVFSAWACFAASIILVVIAMRKAQNSACAAAEEINRLLKELERNRENDVRLTLTMAATRNRSRVVLNNCAIGAFMLGVALLGAFVGLNLLLGP